MRFVRTTQSWMPPTRELERMIKILREGYYQCIYFSVYPAQDDTDTGLPRYRAKVTRHENSFTINVGELSGYERTFVKKLGGMDVMRGHTVSFQTKESVPELLRSRS